MPAVMGMRYAVCAYAFAAPLCTHARCIVLPHSVGMVGSGGDVARGSESGEVSRWVVSIWILSGVIWKRMAL